MDSQGEIFRFLLAHQRKWETLIIKCYLYRICSTSASQSWHIRFTTIVSDFLYIMFLWTHSLWKEMFSTVLAVLALAALSSSISLASQKVFKNLYISDLQNGWNGHTQAALTEVKERKTKAVSLLFCFFQSTEAQ